MTSSKRGGSLTSIEALRTHPNDEVRASDRAGPNVWAPVVNPLRDPRWGRQLRAFAKVHLEPGESTTVRLAVAAQDLGYWDETAGRFVVETARHTVMVGRSCTDIVRTATVTVRGSVVDGRPVAALGVG